MDIKLTAYSHGAGCGCKLSPAVLSEILGDKTSATFEHLLVGNHTKDDAAVFRFDDRHAVISTTDFFMPIVDDPHDFGAIAATNAISDIYAMGGAPLMAIAILGWPIDKLAPEVAGKVLEGGREVCEKAGIPLAGGHSIDAPEPIFGLAVTGRVEVEHLKQNGDAKAGDLLYLTKPLGIGLVTTAQKKGVAEATDLKLALTSMLKLNDIGSYVSKLPYVHAITDVTGFGLGGHLQEVAEASGLGAEVHLSQVPRFSFVDTYLQLGTTPGGTQRNWASYGDKISLPKSSDDFRLIADPQTSGGLLITVDPEARQAFEAEMEKEGYAVAPFGQMITEEVGRVSVV